MSLTSPLGLARHLRRPDLRLEVLPWLNVLLLGLLLWLLGPRYIYAPGLAVGLSPAPNLPMVSGGALSGLSADAMLTVLTAKQDELFIFEGRVYNLDTLAAHLHPPRPLKNGAPSILLLKAGGNVSMQTAMQIFAMARAAGFTTVQLAADEGPAPASAP